MTEKVCPLKFASTDRELTGKYCDGAECAWWLPDYDCCAIVNLSLSVTNIELELEKKEVEP